MRGSGCRIEDQRAPRRNRNDEAEHAKADRLARIGVHQDARPLTSAENGPAQADERLGKGHCICHVDGDIPT
jgi:hypothetical protein